MIVYNIYSVARLETAAGGGVTTGTDVSSTNMILASQHPSSILVLQDEASLETFNKAI